MMMPGAANSIPPSRERRPSDAPPREEYAADQDARSQGRWRRRVHQRRHENLASIRMPGAADSSAPSRERPSDAPTRREYAAAQVPHRQGRWHLQHSHRNHEGLVPMRTPGVTKGPPLDRERTSPRQRTGNSMPPPSPMTPLLLRPTLLVAFPPQGEAIIVQTRGGPMHPPSPPPTRPSRPTSPVSFPPSGRGHPPCRRAGNPTGPAVAATAPLLAADVVGAKGPPLDRKR